MCVFTDLSLCNGSLPEQKIKQILLRNDIILTTPSLAILPLMILPNASVTLRSTQADSHEPYLMLTPYWMAPFNQQSTDKTLKSDYSWPLGRSECSGCFSINSNISNTLKHLSGVGGEPSDAVKCTLYSSVDCRCRLTAITIVCIQDKSKRF